MIVVSVDFYEFTTVNPNASTKTKLSLSFISCSTKGIMHVFQNASNCYVP